MRNGHHAGYMVKKVGDQLFYYCPCLPNVQWNDLKFYDLHYEVKHMGISSYLKKSVSAELIGGRRSK